MLPKPKATALKGEAPGGAGRGPAPPKAPGAAVLQAAAPKPKVSGAAGAPKASEAAGPRRRKPVGSGADGEPLDFARSACSRHEHRATTAAALAAAPAALESTQPAPRAHASARIATLKPRRPTTAIASDGAKPPLAPYHHILLTLQAGIRQSVPS